MDDESLDTERWIRLPVSFLEWEWYQEHSVKILFLHCVLKASSKPTTWQGIELEAGSFVTSISQIKCETGLTIQQIKTALKKLESSNWLTRTTAPRYTVISIEKGMCSCFEQQTNNKKSNKKSNNKRTMKQPNLFTTLSSKKELLENSEQQQSNKPNNKINNNRSILRILNTKRIKDYTKIQDLLLNLSSAPKTSKPVSSAARTLEAQAFFLTKKRRKLAGKRLDTFLVFWEAFGDKRGKAEAADAWLDIPELTNSLVDKIVSKAEEYADSRLDIVSAGHSPKMAQGWITARRWEDEISEQNKLEAYSRGRLPF